MAGQASTSIVFNIDTKQAVNQLDDLSTRAEKLFDMVSKFGAEKFLGEEYIGLKNSIDAAVKSAGNIKSTFDKITFFTKMESLLESSEKFNSKVAEYNSKIGDTGKQIEKISKISFKVDNIEFTSLDGVRKHIDELKSIYEKELKKIKLDIGIENIAKDNIKSVITKYKEDLNNEIKKEIESGNFEAAIPLMYKLKIVSQGYNMNSKDFNEIDEKREIKISKITSDDYKDYGLSKDVVNQLKTEWGKNEKDLIATIQEISAELTREAQHIEVKKDKSGKISIIDDESRTEIEKQINDLKIAVKNEYKDLYKIYKEHENELEKYDNEIQTYSNSIYDNIIKIREISGGQHFSLKDILGSEYNEIVDGQTLLDSMDLGQIELPELSTKGKQIKEVKSQYQDLIYVLKDLVDIKTVLSKTEFKDYLNDNSIDVNEINDAFQRMYEILSQDEKMMAKLGENTGREFQTLVGKVFGEKYILPEFKGTGTGSGDGDGNGTGNGNGKDDGDGSGASSKEIGELKEKLNGIEQTVEDLKTKIENLDPQSYSSAIETINTINNNINSISDSIDKLPKQNIDSEQIEKVNDTLNELKNTLDGLGDLQKLKDLSDKLDEISQKVNTLHDNLVKLQDVKDAIAEALAPIATKEDLSNIGSAGEEAAKKINENAEKIEDAKEREQAAANEPVEVTPSTTESQNNAIPAAKEEEQEAVDMVRQEADTIKKEIDDIAAKYFDAIENLGNANSLEEEKKQMSDIVSLVDEIETKKSKYKELTGSSLEIGGYDSEEAKKAKNDAEERQMELTDVDNIYKDLAVQVANFNEAEKRTVANTDIEKRLERLNDMQAAYTNILDIVKRLNKAGAFFDEDTKSMQLNYRNKTYGVGDDLSNLDKSRGIQTLTENKEDLIKASQMESLTKKYADKIKEITDGNIKNNKSFIRVRQELEEIQKELSESFTAYKKIAEDKNLKNILKIEQTAFSNIKEIFEKGKIFVEQINKINVSDNQTRDLGSKQLEKIQKASNRFLGIPTEEKSKKQEKAPVPDNTDIQQMEKENQTLRDKITLTNEEISRLKELREIINSRKNTPEQLQEYRGLKDRISNELIASGVKKVEDNILKYMDQIQLEMEQGIQARKIEVENQPIESSAISNSSDNSADTSPADNTTLSAILTEVKSINGKMDKPVETKVNNNTGILSDSERYELESYKKRSKDDQALNLWSNYGYDSIQLTKAKINSFSGTLNELIQAIKYELEDRKETIVDDLQNPSGEYDDNSAYSALGNVQQLSGLLEMLNNSGINNGEKVSFDSTAIDNILAEVKAISQKMDTSTTKASNNASPNISANQSPNNTSSSVTTPSISSGVQAASEAATAEVAAFKTIDGAVTGLTGDINTKTEAIRAEATEMVKASQIETSQIGKIVNGVIKLKEEIKSIPKISVTGKNTKSEPIKITAEISDEQIAKIRQRVLDAFGEKNPIPIFFKPNVQSIKKQINDGLKDGLEKLTIQSFDFENAAKNMKETLAKAMSDVGLQFNTKKLRLDIKTAVNAARDAAESAGRGNPTLTTSGSKNSKGSNIDPKKLDRLYASFEKEVAAYYHKNTLILRDEDVDSMFSSIMRDIKKQSKSKENLDVLYRRFSEAQIAAINKGLDFNADKSDIGTAVINKGYETLISQINKYLETNTKLMGSQFEEEFTKLLSEVSKPAQARTDVDLKQLGAEFARLKNYVDEAGLSGNADNEAKKVSKLDRGYATLALDMKKFHEENNKFDKNTEWADRFNQLFSNITGSISRSEVELEDFRAQFANFKNNIPRDLLGSTVTTDFFDNLKGYDIDSIAKIFEKQSGQVKSRLLNDKYGFESPKMTRDISQMLDAQADRLSGLINQENVSDNDIDGIVQHNKQMNNLIDTYQTYSEKRRELQELVSKDSSNEELKRLLQESDALSNSQVYDVQAMKSWSDSYVEAVNNLKTAQSNSEKEQRSSRATSTQQNQYRALTKDIEEATATAQRFKEQYAGLLSDGLNNELNKVIGDMSARSSISVDLSNSSEITTWNDESKKLLDTWTAIQERMKSSVVASGQAGEVITATMDYSQYTRKATNALSNLNNKYKDKLKDKQSAEFEQRLEAIRNKVKEISDDTSKYTANNVQVIETDIQQLEKLAKDFEVVQNSENKINSLIRTLSNSRNSIERRGSTAQPVVNSIDSEKAALEELKRQGQNLDIGNPESVRAFVEKLNEADTTVNKLKNDAEQIRISTNTTASVAKLDSKFNDLLFKVDKFRRDNSKITSDKGISAQFDSLMRSIQTIEKSDVNFQRLRAQFDQLKATVQGKGLTGRSLGDELKYIAEKIGIKAMLGNSIYRVIGAFRQMVGIVTELDTGMTTLRRVTEETEATYRKFLKTAGDEAHELGSTVSGLVDSTGDFARLGYNIQEANALAKNAVMYSNVGWLDIQTATADMTSTMKAFNIEASDSIRIVDTFDILGKKLPLVTISVKGWRHSRPSKDIVNHNICVTTAGGVW